MKILKEKLADNKIDSFWYHGEEIAVIEREDGTKLIAEARGEIALAFEVDGTCYKGEQAIEEATAMDLVDEDLHKLTEDDLWRMNNWFVVVEIDKDGNCGDDLAIGSDYDEILELLKKVNEEN